MYKTVLIISMILMYLAGSCQESNPVEINEMKVDWHFIDDRIYFEMIAPTDGWVTIGFNNKAGTTGAYLLMGNIIEGQVNLVEHYTKSPGNYLPISELGAKPQVENVNGVEGYNQTTIKFSLPIKSMNKYQKDLSKGTEYIMIIAYSQEDDFQHHSIMRTSVNIRL